MSDGVKIRLLTRVAHTGEAGEVVTVKESVAEGLCKRGCAERVSTAVRTSRPQSVEPQSERVSEPQQSTAKTSYGESKRSRRKDTSNT